MANKLDNDDEGFNDINITPFVDVVLVLLVIFMVTAPVMIKESLKVNLPKTLTSDFTSKAASIGVAVTKEGQVLLNGKLYGDSELAIELKKISATASETTFLISADTDSRHGDVVRLIDLLKRNNINRFALQVEKIKGQ
ncbi:MAG TPA: biopolymer transporter ExbD [Bacteriovoracaceae bacterium]|nr:biopolymer transporter ExbD [Bacteriovoracaceae bacterium]